MYKILFLLISATTFLFSACDSDCPRVVNYKFQIPLTLNPAQDSFFIGDTIWISSVFSEELLDLNSNKSYPLEDFKFYTEFTFAQIDISPFEDANSQFEIIPLEGEAKLVSLYNSSYIEIHYTYQDEMYQANFGFIPKKSGLFNFVASSSIGFFDLDREIDLSPCKYEQVEFIYKMNDGINNNYEYIALSPDSLIKTTTKEIYDEYAQYGFYVVE